MASESLRSEISEPETRIAEFESENASLKADLRNNEESINRMTQELEERQSRDMVLQSRLTGEKSEYGR